MQKTPSITQMYENDPKFFLQIYQLVALAYISVPDKITSFEELIASPYYIEHEGTLLSISNYSENTWIGRLDHRRNRRSPKYSTSLENCFRSASTGLLHTNNPIEGWHRGFNSLLGAYHPIIRKFIDALKQELSLNELKIEQFIASAGSN